MINLVHADCMQLRLLHVSPNSCQSYLSIGSISRYLLTVKVVKKRESFFRIYLDLLCVCGCLGTSVSTVGVPPLTAIGISAISFLIYMGIAIFTGLLRSPRLRSFLLVRLLRQLHLTLHFPHTLPEKSIG